MMRARTLLIPLGLVLFLGVGTALLTLFSADTPTAEAQRATSPDHIRIGVVDFTRLSSDLSDVEKIRDLMSLLDELRRIEERYWREQIRELNNEIDTAEMFNMPEEREEKLEERRVAEAAYDAAQQVAEFRMRKLATMYSSRLLQKILDRIEQYSDGRFDLVFKVLGDPGEATGEDIVGEAQKLNLAQAREVLYYDTQSRYVSDITDRVRRAVNQPGPDDVSQALDDAIGGVRDEIQEWRERAGN